MKFNKLNESLDQERQKKIEELNLGQVGAAVGNMGQKIKQGVSNIPGNIKQGAKDFKNNVQHSTQMKQAANNNLEQAKIANADSELGLEHKTIKDKEKELLNLINKFAQVIKNTDDKSIKDAQNFETAFASALKQYETLGKAKADNQFEKMPQDQVSESIITQILNEVAAAAANSDMINYFRNMLTIMQGATPGDAQVVAKLKEPYQQALAGYKEQPEPAKNVSDPSNVLNSTEWGPEQEKFIMSLQNEKYNMENIKNAEANKITPNQIRKMKNAMMAAYGQDSGKAEAWDKRIDTAAKNVSAGSDVGEVNDAKPELANDPDEPVSGEEEEIKLKNMTFPFKQKATALYDLVKSDVDNQKKLAKATALGLGNEIPAQVKAALKDPNTGPLIINGILATASKDGSVTKTEDFDMMLFSDQILYECIKQSKKIIL